MINITIHEDIDYLHGIFFFKKIVLVKIMRGKSFKNCRKYVVSLYILLERPKQNRNNVFKTIPAFQIYAFSTNIQSAIILAYFIYYL